MKRLKLCLALLGALGIGLWLGVPHLTAWYHWRASQAAMDRYHSAEALTHLHACLSTWPNSVPTHLLASRAARRAGDFDEARRHLQECHRLENEPSPETELEEALLSAALGDLDLVEAYLESWIASHAAQAALAWEALAEGYLRVYRIQDALRCLELWLRRDPNNPQALFLRGNVARQLGSHKRALPDYQRVVELDPERTEVRRLLALCYLEAGRFDEAAAHLNLLRREQPDDPELSTRLARCQSKLGRFTAARQTLAQVLSKHPNYGMALRVRGSLALLEQHPAEAETWLCRAVAALPYDYETNWAYYRCLHERGKKTLARAQLGVAEDIKKRLERLEKIKTHDMSQRPHDPLLHAELGALLLNLGYPEVGRDWLLSALRLDPNCRAAHKALADFYAGRKEEDKAAYHRAKAAEQTSAVP
jgi:tetratricopeptide (TPR) repeat protein